MRAVLDTGAFIAIDRDDREVAAMIRVLQEERTPLRTSAVVVAQVWRNGAVQANLARLLTGVDIAAIDSRTGKAIGVLLGQNKSDDVVDGHVAMLVSAGDRVLTSDPADMRDLLKTRGVRAEITTV